MNHIAYVLVNFGGPRDSSEIEEFLIELLTDQEVVRTPFPAWIHRLWFTRVAKKRSRAVSKDYALIGGASPIFQDTQTLAAHVSQKLGHPVHVFHRYLPQTHAAFVKQIQTLTGVDQIVVVPLFPQFSYATTGSIALWFSNHLSPAILKKMRWIRTYATHPAYIEVMQQTLRECLRPLQEQDTLLLFSAHGLPQQFVDTGDPYQKECEACFAALRAFFPEALSVLSYQSQWGRQPWIEPYTSTVCQQIERYAHGRAHVVVIPLSFTSDHIETLYEVEHIYLPLIRARGLQAHRCPALNLRTEWVDVVADLFVHGGASHPNTALMRMR